MDESLYLITFIVVHVGFIVRALLNRDPCSAVSRARRPSRALLAAACLVAAPWPARAEVTQVARPCEGSSNPTFHPNNHRVAVTDRGRVIVVYDPHGSGVQIAWRDPGARWSTKTRGATGDGSFELKDEIGDRTASIAVARDRRGHEHAWIVWSGHDFSSGHLLSVQMVRLNELDDPAGPRVGGITTVESAGKGNARVDLAFERARRGKRRGVIGWLRRIDDDTYGYVVAWFTDLRTNAPGFRPRKTLFSTSSDAPTGTFVSTRNGMRLVMRTPAGNLRVFRHRLRAPLRRWTRGRARVAVRGAARPSAIDVSSRRIMVATESPAGDVRVIRFARSGNRARRSLHLRGHSQPTIAARRGRAWVVMVRRQDGLVVSRRFVAGSGWTRRDHVEVGASQGGAYALPNALRDARGGLSVLLQGRGCSNNPNGNEVLFYRRRL